MFFHVYLANYFNFQCMPSNLSVQFLLSSAASFSYSLSLILLFPSSPSFLLLPPFYLYRFDHRQFRFTPFRCQLLLCLSHPNPLNSLSKLSAWQVLTPVRTRTRMRTWTWTGPRKGRGRGTRQIVRSGVHLRLN